MSLYPDRSDEELVAAVAAGDTAALGQLVQRHQERVLSLAYRILLRWDLAEDVGQEVFLRVWSSAGDYRPKARFTTWLYRVVVNVALDAIRRARRQPVQLAESFADVPAGDPPDHLVAEERAASVAKAVAALPERQRIALVLHVYEDLRCREVAEVTGWSASAVESLLVRAYAALRLHLADLDTDTGRSQGNRPKGR